MLDLPAGQLIRNTTTLSDEELEGCDPHVRESVQGARARVSRTGLRLSLKWEGVAEARASQLWTEDWPGPLFHGDRRWMQMRTYTLRSDPEPAALTKARLLSARVGEAVTRAAMKSRSTRCFSLADKIDG